MTEEIPDIAIDLSPLAGMNVPHFDQYLGVWAVEESRFLSAVDHVRRLDLASHVLRQQSPESQALLAEQAGRDYAVFPGGIAVINLVGPLMKFVGSMQAGTSTIAARRAIRNAAADESVLGILLRIDSPGGTVAGTQDLASDVSFAAKKKPVHAYIEDLGASAAYWIASQASVISANATGLIGSIGTFAVVEDSSQAAAAEGIKVHVVRAGDFKGSGVPGTPVPEGYLLELQRVVNELNQHFLEGVAKGRKLSASAVRQLADGRVHVGEAAKTLGLINSVGSFDQAVAELRKATKPQSGVKTAMSEPTPPRAATYQEIVANCPGIKTAEDSNFICDQLAKQHTVEQASRAWVETLKARAEIKDQEIAAKDAKIAELEAKANAAPPAPPVKQGVKPIPTSPGATEEAASTSAKERFEALVQPMVASGTPRHLAHAKVGRANPELRQQMIDEANANAKRGRRA